MTVKGLGNAVPTDDEHRRMETALEGLRERLNARGSEFDPPTYNVDDDTFELRWSHGGRAWVSAWIDALCAGRGMRIWRHPSYREPADEQYIYENERAP